MKISYLQIGLGILLGIVLCIKFPRLPEQIRQMAHDYKKRNQINNGVKAPYTEWKNEKRK